MVFWSCMTEEQETNRVVWWQGDFIRRSIEVVVQLGGGGVWLCGTVVFQITKTVFGLLKGFLATALKGMINGSLALGTLIQEYGRRAKLVTSGD